jgi:hypothetical protein
MSRFERCQGVASGRRSTCERVRKHASGPELRTSGQAIALGERHKQGLELFRAAVANAPLCFAASPRAPRPSSRGRKAAGRRCTSRSRSTGRASPCSRVRAFSSLSLLFPIFLPLVSASGINANASHQERSTPSPSAARNTGTASWPRRSGRTSARIRTSSRPLAGRPRRKERMMMRMMSRRWEAVPSRALLSRAKPGTIRRATRWIVWRGSRRSWSPRAPWRT